MALDPTGVRTCESSIPILCMTGTSAVVKKRDRVCVNELCSGEDDIFCLSE